MEAEKSGMSGLKAKLAKQYIPGIHNFALIWAVVIVICVLLITLYAFQSMRYLKSMTMEKYISYSAGANQRFEQRNSDPTLGKQFGPYNMEITGQQAIFGRSTNPYEHLTSESEAPVIYNIGSDMGGQPYPPAVSVPYPRNAGNAGNSMNSQNSRSTRAAQPEAGLSPNNDSAEASGGDSSVESLMSELYG